MKKISTIIAILLSIITLLSVSACEKSVEASGIAIVSGDTYMIYLENSGVAVMYADDDKIFQGVQNGTEITVKYDGVILETFPGKMTIKSLEITGEGAGIYSIERDVLENLYNMGYEIDEITFYSEISGRAFLATNSSSETVCFIVQYGENSTPYVLNCEDSAMLENITTGDEIKVIYDSYGAMPAIFPGSIKITSLEKISEGSIEDIYQSTIESLSFGYQVIK